MRYGKIMCSTSGTYVEFSGDLVRVGVDGSGIFIIGGMNFFWVCRWKK